jgi:hypothetical protein
VELGFQRDEAEHAMHTRGIGNRRLIVGVYVDDLIITGGNSSEVKQFKLQMQDKFQMTDLGKLRFYLGLEVEQRSNGTMVSQGAYALKILKAAALAGCNPSHTPMEQRLKLSKSSTAPAVDPTEYRRIAGALRYLVNTRPDLAYAMGYVSRFMEKPTVEHLLTVKKVLRYVTGTVHQGCDSDLVGDVDTRKSTTGVLFFLGDSMVSWQSQKQRVVALSSCEAEYIAAATTSCQGVWLGRLLAEILAEIRGEDIDTVTLKIDNMSAIQLSRNPVFHEQSKHIGTRYHYIRQCIEEGRVQVEAVNTNDQLADILTKSLRRNRLVELTTKIGIVNTQEVIKT